MFDLHLLSDATSQITGEDLRRARLRLAATDRYDRLVPSASAAQALLESVILTALGAGTGPQRTRPFGIREAHPILVPGRYPGSQLELRVECQADVQALLDHLPYQSKRGTWRGTRGLMVQIIGRSLHFGLRDWAYDRPWDTSEPQVTVTLPREEDLPELLTAHTERIRTQAGTPRWDVAAPEPGPKRAEPASRSLLRQLSPASALGSALLRRPRLWDRLAGHTSITVSPQTDGDGVEWTVDRTVNGDSFDEDRFISLLTDRVVGCGLILMDHTCTPQSCVVRLSPAPIPRNNHSPLVVRSRRVPASTAPSAPKTVVAIGERRATARPVRPVRSAAPRVRDGRVILLMSADQFSGLRRHLGREELARVAEQLAAVWAAQGRHTAVLRLPRDEPFSLVGSSRSSAAPSTPADPPAWRTLRLAPPPGSLWSGEADPMDLGQTVAVGDARRRFDCTILPSETWADVHVLRELADFSLLLHPTSPYPREITIGGTGPGAKTISLTASEAASQWRAEELGRWSLPVTGLLLQTGWRKEEQPLDDFDGQVEQHLSRFGTPVVGRFPYSGYAVRGPGHSDHPPTVLDPETTEPLHAQMIRAADELAERLSLFSPTLPQNERGAPHASS
ncbi:hypothetical protein ACIGHB_29730 [Streptomyces sp. NPDC085460]|uniref:hypothetical protein n=1 Tax=Streptomyces sp. NPDC085460 TaxID=3365723 RepID=UPI0037D00000